MAGGKVGPRQRCLKFEQWPEQDQLLWRAGTETRPRSFKASSLASRLAPASLEKTKAGYGRFLGFLAWSGRLDGTQDPATRITREVADAFYELMREVGNADHTIVGRFEELQRALRLMVPEGDWRWLTNPDGWSLRSSFLMQRREIVVYHSKIVYRWGLELIETAAEARTRMKSRAQVRDGVMIALLSFAAPRLRSIAGMHLGQQLQECDGRFRVVFSKADMKNKRPIEFAVPASLDPHITRYLANERRELLAGGGHENLWIHVDGGAMTSTAIKTMIRLRSERRFGKAFGIHAFRHFLATTAQLVDPTHPGIGPALLGITGPVCAKHYNLATRVNAAHALHDALADARAEFCWG